MKRKQRLWMKQFLCWLLCISMIAPSAAPIVAEAATGLSNLPRSTEFVRPEALTLKELGLETATASQATPSEVKPSVSSTVTAATPSELRRPQDFYEIPDDEPGGVLVQFDAERNIRTYMQSEGEYITMVGGYSGLYEDEASNIRLIDNDLVSAMDHQKPSDSDDEEESEDNSEDMVLINDLGLSSGIDETAVTASPSNTKRLRSVQTATASNAYYNAAGKLSVYIPGQMDGRNGYELSNGEDSIEVIPQGGTYTHHMVRDNAIRYSNVYENVDVQYTVLGDTVKEDIILLDRTGVNSFSYKLKSSSLKFRRNGDAVIAYKNSVKEPVFALTAPVMIDAAGNTSTAISLNYDSSKKIVTYTADEDWLNAEEREYPVRIDPTGATLVDYTAFQLNMVAKADYERNVGGSTEEVPVLQPHAYNTCFGSNVNPMAGYSEEYGYCRALIHIDTAWEALMDHEATQTEGPGIKNVELKLNTMTHDAVDRTGFAAFIAGNSWDPGTVTWAKMKAAGVDENMVQAGEIQYSNGSGEEMTFDITDIYYKWVSGEAPRNGLVIQAYAEAGDTVYHPGDEDKSPVSWAETFYNQNGGSQFGPCLRVVWEGKLQNRNLEILDMSEFSVDVGAGVVETEAGGRDVKGVLAHGISQADSTIEYRLHNKNGDIEVTGSAAAGLSAECPDYQEVHGDCLWAKYQDSNWQSDPVLTLDPLEMNKIYYFTARGTGKEIVENEKGELEQGTEEVTTDWKKTDEFLLYLVQASDILPRIARYYGVSTNTLRDDNQFGYQLAEAGEAILIRNPATEEPYTAPLSNDQLEEFIRNCLLNGHDPRCVLGGEPVNLSTGSFYMTQEDAAFDDLDGSFAITRSYNGLTPYFRSEFGMGWNSSIGERIMVLQDGSILFTREDGKGLVFTKTGEESFEAPEGYDYELRPVDAIDLVMGSDTEEEGTQADSETDSGEEAAAVSLFSLEEETEPEGDASDEETGEEESGIEPVEPSTGWEITEPDGTVRVFNAYGLLVSKKNRKGHAVSYVYDEDYLLTEIIAPSGKSYEVTMEADGKIMEIGLADGTSVVYEYDEEDNLVSVTDPEGGIKRFEYDENHRMTAWYDENGTKVIENILDEEGRVTEQTDALGNVMYFTYGSDQTEMTDNRGNTTVYHLDSLRRNVRIEYPNGDTERTSYSDDNRIESRTDANGSTTRYTYDENGNVLTETREDGSRAEFTYNEWNLPLSASDYEGNTSHFSYDEVGNLLSMTDGAGNTTRYEYDELSRLITITDANGGITSFSYEGTEAPVVSMTDPEGQTSSFTYDEMNRVLTQTDPEGNTTEHVYNANGWEVAAVAADGGVTSYEFSPAGEVLSITDAMGAETTFTYDRMHNILSGQDALGNTLEYSYDENYNKISETNAKGDVTAYEYDERNRLTRVTDALGNAISYELDGNGNVLSVTDRRGNVSESSFDEVLGLPTVVTDELGNETHYTYDRNGNLTGIAYPDGSSVSYAYNGANRLIRTTAQNGLVTETGYDGNGNITRITDDETRVYRFRYDGCNRLVKATDPLGGVTEYAYDGAGNQIQVTDANGNSADYVYDAAGRLKEVQDALGGVVSSEYDLMGRTLSVTDQNGHTTIWRYDVIGQTLAEADAAENVTAMEYDSLGNVTKIIDALKGETAMDVDALSRTVKVTDAMGGVYTYEYDANGNLLTVAMPDGDSVHMAYDAANRMTLFRDEASVITRYEYDSMGRITKAEDTIGNVMTYEYDLCGNLVKQTDTIGRDAVYEYDQFNRLTAVTGTDLATTTYEYDALDRLRSVTAADGTTTAYEYDPVGNLIKTTEPGEAVYTYAYDAINRLTGKVNPVGASAAFQYDAKGNLTGTVDGEGNTNAYVYDVIDRLTNVTDGRGNETVYEYDELSRLLSQTTPEGNKTEYLYDALGRLTKAKDPNSLITEYQYDVMGNLIGSISPKGAKTSYTYDKHDELTSETDPAGNVTQYAVDLNRRVTEMTQKNGAKYQYAYDAVHRLTGITTPLGLTTTLTYDAADNVIRETDNLDRTNTYEYDIMHRMTKSINAEGGITSYGYDIRGNRNQLNDALGYTWNYRYDLVDQLTASVDPEGKATEFTYNLVGEIASITKPGSRRTDFQYDGNYNVTAISDPKGYIYEYTYDKDNRLTGTRNPLGETESISYDPGSRVTGVTDRMGLTESYTYDPHGNVLSVTAANGLVTRFAYDILDNLVKVTMPSNLTTSYTYDVMGNVTSMTDTMLRTTQYTYDAENNLTSITDAMGRKEQMTYDIGGRQTGYISSGGNRIHYDYDRLNDIVEKSYEDARDPEGREGVVYGYDIMGQRISMMDRSGESKYEYDGLGRIIKVTSGSGEVTEYAYDECDQLESITYADGKKVSYKYDKNDNLTEVTDRTGAVTAYVYDAINRVTEIHRPNGVSTYNTYNARDQIVSMKNICDDCGWVISQYDYTYDDRGFIVAEDAVESLYGYAWDDKHDGKHENGRHDDLYPHGNQHTNKHAKDGEYNFQIIETKRAFEYDEDGKLTKAVEDEDRQGQYIYLFVYDDMGNRTYYEKSRNGTVQESAACTYNAANQLVQAKIYNGKKTTTLNYGYDADGNRITETGKIGTDKVELTYTYTVENRLKAVHDADELLAAMAYDGDGNRIFMLNYNLHTDDDWKGNSGNGNGNNKDNSGSGSSGTTVTTSEDTGLLASIVSFFTGEDEEETAAAATTATESTSDETDNGSVNGNKDKDKGNDGNDTNNGVGNGNGNSNGNSGNNGNGNGNSGSDETTDSSGTAGGNTTNTDGSTNQSGILFPIDGEVSDLEQELIDLIKTTGKQKNYELVEYVNDVNREHTEVLMELNINGIMDTAYSYGNERLTNERFTGWTGYYTYDPRGSVTGVTDSEGMIWQSYRYDAYGNITFGKPQYNNVYSYNAESYNPNMDVQYLRARYYCPTTANFMTEDTYLGDITDPLTLNRYNYVKSSPLNYTDPSGHYIETAVDIASFLWSLEEFRVAPAIGTGINLIWDFVAVLGGGVPATGTAKAGASALKNLAKKGRNEVTEELVEKSAKYAVDVNERLTKKALKEMGYETGEKVSKEILENAQEKAGTRLADAMEHAHAKIAVSECVATVIETKADSSKLGRALELSGVKRIGKVEAHHIVPGNVNTKDAQAARDILEKYGIGINDAINGVFLPRVSEPLWPSLPTTSHIETFGGTYASMVYKRIKDLSSRDEVINELSEIGLELELGIFFD